MEAGWYWQCLPCSESEEVLSEHVVGLVEGTEGLQMLLATIEMKYARQRVIVCGLMFRVDTATLRRSLDSGK